MKIGPDSLAFQSSLFEKDDPTLVAAAKQDRAAFGVLYYRYAPRVYKYLRARLENDDDAADLTQQVFLQALAALPKYQSLGAPFSAWLFRIAANAITDVRRRQQAIVGWEDIPESQHPPLDQSVEGIVLHHEAILRLQKLLDHLEPSYREVILLRFIANLTVREIAEIMGKSEATIYRYLSGALNILKERLGYEAENTA
jgi:RNA polymerase sigma-70 factor (ECF subfamily)